MSDHLSADELHAEHELERSRYRREKRLADALEDLHRYSLVPDHGYVGSPCEAKVRAALVAAGRQVP